MENKVYTQNDITSINDLVEFSKGQIVALPPFAEGQKFIARLKRPSMLSLIKSGKIPNSLMSKAQELFEGSQKYSMKNDENSLNDIFDILEIMADASFANPTYKEIKDAGIVLTDEQLLFIFNYSQEGVKAITPSI